MLTALIFIAYFLLLYGLGRWSSQRSTNDSFFRGERKSRWPMVAFGMIGASISGVTFVSVPGMVLLSDMTYLQMCLGFIVGYFLVAFVLLPVYYRLNLTTIYGYLDERLGRWSHRTGSSFFILSKAMGASLRFYLAAAIVQQFWLDAWGVPFPLTALGMVLLVWLYTRRGGIRTLVSTDVVQTCVMLIAVVLLIGAVMQQLNLSPGEVLTAVANDSHSRIFVTDDWRSPLHFAKQFLSGVFVVVVMTGLDQDMMQKNLTCRTLRDAQKDMCSYGFAFVPVNALFLVLGVLLVMLAAQEGTPLPQRADELLPTFVQSGLLGQAAQAFFLLGILASAFSSADSAMTALTTTVCIDLFNRADNTRLRQRVHLAVAGGFALLILVFAQVSSGSIINDIYILCGYTYGPLLGLFTFGLFGRRSIRDKAVPAVCLAAPIITWLIDRMANTLYNYHFGYELLLLNGLLTYLGLYLCSRANHHPKAILTR